MGYLLQNRHLWQYLYPIITYDWYSSIRPVDVCVCVCVCVDVGIFQVSKYIPLKNTHIQYRV